MNRKCRYEGCATEPRPRQWVCTKHRKRITRYGSPDGEAWSITERRHRKETARVLAGRGLTAEQIARRIGVTERTVYRWQAEERRAATVGVAA